MSSAVPPKNALNSTVPAGLNSTATPSFPPEYARAGDPKVVPLVPPTQISPV